jgi:hypothetical protein
MQYAIPNLIYPSGTPVPGHLALLSDLMPCEGCAPAAAAEARAYGDRSNPSSNSRADPDCSVMFPGNNVNTRKQAGYTHLKNNDASYTAIEEPTGPARDRDDAVMEQLSAERS